MPKNGITIRLCLIAGLAFALLAAFLPSAFGQSSVSDEQNSGSQVAPSQDSASAPAPEPDADAQGNPPSLITPLKPHREDEPYDPITARQRLRWFITNTIGPSHLAGGAMTSALGTALDRPKEYGPGWAGFGDRFGMRLTGVVTGNAIEGSVGALWGEDPRYFRVPDQPFGARMKNVMKQTFEARRRDGGFAPAYARFIAEPGNNFLSNAWRPASEANTHDALLRTGEGFAGRMAANAFQEFWPDIERRLLHRDR
jgi:hypothetical protein